MVVEMGDGEGDAGIADESAGGAESGSGSGADGGAAPGGRLSRRRRWVTGLVVGAVVLAGGGVGAATLIKSPSQAAADARPPAPSVLTADVEYRVLASTVITRGQVTAGQSVQVAPQISGGEGSGAPVVTKVGVGVGDTVRAGQVLLEVSGRPVIALPGRVPVYRDLKPGATGGDVRQLQEALRGLGHGTGGDALGTFGAGTKTALTAFYASLGYDPLPALDDDGAGLKSARDAVTGAQRAVEDARAGGRGGGDSAAGEEASGGDSGRQLERAKEDLATARTELAKAEAAAGPKLPAGEVVFLQGFPARVDAVQGKVGAQVTGAVMTVSAGRLIVQAYLQEHQKGLVRKGQKVEIHSELTGISARAKVTSVADTLSAQGQDTGGSGTATGGQGDNQDGGNSRTGESGYLLEVTPDRPLDAKLAGQDVRLAVQAATTDGKALVVPITAITAGADGRTTVTVLTSGGARRQVEVEPGTVGDGFVAVTPTGGATLKKGDKVVTGVTSDGANAKGSGGGAADGEGDGAEDVR
ncbi:peptidoglycan-binding protein [Streptomyces sp. Q6]|uniref:Peptidoglycan-binding protein n=1 Tax=Streptomyces citrinus TaxID=3118173 RepID=A0ACD5ACR3_9ACTN